MKLLNVRAGLFILFDYNLAYASLLSMRFFTSLNSVVAVARSSAAQLLSEVEFDLYVKFVPRFSRSRAH